MGTVGHPPNAVVPTRRLLQLREVLQFALAGARRVTASGGGRLGLYCAVLVLMVAGDALTVMATAVRFQLELAPQTLTVRVDGQTLQVPLTQAVSTLVFASGPADLREYQIDGTDNTNNFTETPADIASLLPSPAYRAEAWMRGQYSTWSAVSVGSVVLTGATQPARPLSAAGGSSAVVIVGHTGTMLVTAWLQRPEAPVSVIASSAGAQELASLQVDRNVRTIVLAGSGGQQAEIYFPTQPLPFLAEVADSVLRVVIWAWVVLGATSAAALAFAWGSTMLMAARFGDAMAAAAERHMVAGHPGAWMRRVSVSVARWVANACFAFATAGLEPGAHAGTHVREHQSRWRSVLRHISPYDRAAAGIALAALGWVAWIALVQYQSAPHILDASAYFFQAKIFASGRLSAPAPADVAAFQGPFMVVWQGRWFAQYPPVTSIVLALGMVVHAPELVEPLLGTAALFGIYLLGRRLYGAPAALLALLLGALSPFYAYLAASYLSHAVALCCEVYFLWFLVRFADTLHARHLVAAVACLAAMFGTREASAVVIGILATGWIVGWRWRALAQHFARLLPGILAAGAVLMAGLLLYLLYNFAQTGDPLLLPRLLFSSADRYGFGVGIGFYGQHTLAAGLVILDQLLTSLLIDLYGWPFYLTLAFVPLALLRRDGASRWDWFALMCASMLFALQAGYFYHGIFLGPRYLYETLPFLLLLTGRGVLALSSLVARVLRRLGPLADTRRTSLVARGVSGGLCALLLLFNLGFYLPRQLAQHAEFTGLPTELPVDTAAIYGARLHQAVVVTDNWMIYNYVLWPLNDPDLRGAVLYAYAPTDHDALRIAGEYPRRTILMLQVDGSGHVHFVPWRG